MCFYVYGYYTRSLHEGLRANERAYGAVRANVNVSGLIYPLSVVCVRDRSNEDRL